MLIEYLKAECTEAMKSKRFVCAVEIERYSKRGRKMKRKEVLEVIEGCSEIKCKRDDLLITYSIYYKKNQEEREARVMAIV